MKKVTIMMSVLMAVGLFSACSSDDEVVGMGNGSDFEMKGEEDFDSVYQVKYYTQVPGLNMKQGYWTPDGFIELFPQSTAPYSLLVWWNDEQGKKAIDYILEKNPDVMTKEAYSDRSNEYRITSDIYFESPYIYVSSYYKTSEWNSYNIVVLPQIMLKMKDGKSVETIIKDYADIMTLNKEIELKALGPYSLYLFDCNVKTSRALLELNVEIYQRDDVEYSDFNTYGDYDF